MDLKYYFLALFLLLNISKIEAFTPPESDSIAFVQPWGETIRVKVNASEYSIYYTTAKGDVLVADGNNQLCWAIKDGHQIRRGAPYSGQQHAKMRGQMGKMQRQWGQLQERKAIKEAIKAVDGNKRYGGLYRHGAKVSATGLQEKGKSGWGMLESIGNPKVPVLMVEFADSSMNEKVTEEYLNGYFNGENFKEYGNYGSINSYFKAQSNELFSPDFDVLGKVRLPKGYAYYGMDVNANKDAHMNEYYESAIKEALKKGMSLEKYKDEDGEVPLIILIHVGDGQESQSKNTQAIWSKFQQNHIEVDGLRVGSYLTVGAWRSKNNSPNTIGTLCHEMGHALGLPDFYPTIISEENQKNICGFSYWSVMDYGQFQQATKLPMLYSAFERASLGWTDVEVLNEDIAEVQLAPIGCEEKEKKVLMIEDADHVGRYFLLEHRNQGEWYVEKLFGKGLLISVIDFDEKAFGDNQVNVVPHHLRCSYLPADLHKNTHQDLSKEAKFLIKENPELAKDKEALMAKIKCFKNDLFGSATYRDLTQEKYNPFLMDKHGFKLPFELKEIHLGEDEEGSLRLTFLSLTTSIDAPLQEKNIVSYYNLQGKRISSPKEPGIYIKQEGNRKQKILIW